MADKSFGEYIMLDPMEVPTIQQLEHAVEALKHCESVYAQMPRKKDPPAGSMEMVSSFLETIINNYRSKLRKGKIDDEASEKTQ